MGDLYKNSEKLACVESNTLLQLVRMLWCKRCQLLQLVYTCLWSCGRNAARTTVGWGRKTDDEEPEAQSSHGLWSFILISGILCSNLLSPKVRCVLERNWNVTFGVQLQWSLPVLIVIVPNNCCLSWNLKKKKKILPFLCLFCLLPATSCLAGVQNYAYCVSDLFTSDSMSRVPERKGEKKRNWPCGWQMVQNCGLFICNISWFHIVGCFFVFFNFQINVNVFTNADLLKCPFSLGDVVFFKECWVDPPCIDKVDACYVFKKIWNRI